MNFVGSLTDPEVEEKVSFTILEILFPRTMENTSGDFFIPRPLFMEISEFRVAKIFYRFIIIQTRIRVGYVG